MKNMTIILSALLLFTFSCKSKKDTSVLLDVTKDQEVLDEYFMAATVGVISAADELKFVLKEPLDSDVAEDILQKVVVLSPAVAGKVTLSNNTIITFTPDEPLQSDMTYTVNLDLKSLDSKRFDKNIEYQIKTFAQDMKVEREGLIINDDASVSIYSWR
jgi:citrate lyase gamma subunit